MTETVSGSPQRETQVISVRYWASARSAAGVDGEQLETDAPLSLTEVRRQLSVRHGVANRLDAVLDACSVLVGDRPVSSEDPDDVVVPVGASVEFLPPFAGG